VEEFLRWARRAGVPQEVAEKCAREHPTGDIYAYLCAQQAVAQRSGLAQQEGGFSVVGKSPATQRLSAFPLTNICNLEVARSFKWRLRLNLK